jgi:hypothetical protein
MFASSGDGITSIMGLNCCLVFRIPDDGQSPYTPWFCVTSWLFRSCWNSPIRENKLISRDTNSNHWAVITSASFSGGPQFKSRLLRLILLWIFSVLASFLAHPSPIHFWTITPSFDAIWFENKNNSNNEIKKMELLLCSVKYYAMKTC